MKLNNSIDIPSLFNTLLIEFELSLKLIAHIPKPSLQGFQSSYWNLCLNFFNKWLCDLQASYFDLVLILISLDIIDSELLLKMLI